MPRPDTLLVRMRFLVPTRLLLIMRGTIFLTLGITFLAFLLFFLTGAKGITWSNQGADSAELVTAVAVGGVPHPPGFPTYMLIGRAWETLVPLGDLAFRLNTLSAFLGAGAVGMTFLLTRIVLILAIKPNARAETQLTAAAVLAATSLAAGPLLWSQATIAEVYTLNAAIFAMVLFLGLTWWNDSRKETRRLDYLLLIATILLGLGIGNHPTLVVLLVTGVPVLLLSGKMNRREWGRLALAFGAGLLVYLYLPIAASQEPPVNWGRPSSLTGFWWVVSGTPYRGYLFGLPLSEFPARLALWIDLVYVHFNLLGVLVGVLGAWHLFDRARGLALFFGGCASILIVYSLVYYSRDSFLYLIPAAQIFSVLVGLGAYWLIQRISDLLRARATIGVLWFGLFLFGPVLTMGLNFSGMDLSEDRDATGFVERVVRTVPAGSMILASSDERSFAIWYASYVSAPELELVPVISPMVALPYSWYWETLRANHPDAVPDIPSSRAGLDRLRDLVEHNLPYRTVYLADQDQALEGLFNVSPEGELWRVRSFEIPPDVSD